MTDLETELTRQIHELSKELMALRERVAVLETRPADTTTPRMNDERRIRPADR